MNKELLITVHLSLAESLAKTLFRRAPRHTDLADLISSAYLGLVDAANKFDPARSSFVTYATVRIKGEILSFIAAERKYRYRAGLSLEEDHHGSTIRDDLVAKKESDLKTWMESLDDLGKKLIVWYYEDQLTMREIGDKIGVQQPRVSKLLKMYLDRLAA